MCKREGTHSFTCENMSAHVNSCTRTCTRNCTLICRQECRRTILQTHVQASNRARKSTSTVLGTSTCTRIKIVRTSCNWQEQNLHNKADAKLAKACRGSKRFPHRNPDRVCMHKMERGRSPSSVHTSTKMEAQRHLMQKKTFEKAKKRCR